MIPMRAAALAILLLVLLLAACRPSGGEASPSPTGWTGELTGTATAGPVCPVERTPPDPSCEPRPVAGATLIVQDAAGHTVARLLTDASGHFDAHLPAGRYRLVPQPVEGLMGVAPAVDFAIGPGSPAAALDVSYDTGIR